MRPKLADFAAAPDSEVRPHRSLLPWTAPPGPAPNLEKKDPPVESQPGPIVRRTHREPLLRPRKYLASWRYQSVEVLARFSTAEQGGRDPFGPHLKTARATTSRPRWADSSAGPAMSRSQRLPSVESWASTNTNLACPTLDLTHLQWPLAVKGGGDQTSAPRHTLFATERSRYGDRNLVRDRNANPISELPNFSGTGRVPATLPLPSRSWHFVVRAGPKT